MRRPLLVLAVPCLLAACSQDDASLGGEHEYHQVLDQAPEPTSDLDILFVVDDSGSMYRQQQLLVTEADASLFGELAFENDGVLPNLHVAVTSTSVQLGAYSDLGGCQAQDVDDGRFLGGASCNIDGTFLTDVDDGAGGRVTNYTDSLSATFACQASLGVEGCGFEQPLQAMKLALDGSNAENADFLRDDAMLLVVFLTDEDDCSASDDALFDPADESLGPLSSFRCFEYGVVCDPDEPRAVGEKDRCAPREDSAYEQAVASYVDYLVGVKGDPSKVMVAGIFGSADGVDVEPDPNLPGHLMLGDLCGGGDATSANPAVRLGAFTDAFPARDFFSDICAAPMDKSLSDIAHRISGVMQANACLLGALPAQPTCRAYAQSPGGARRELPAPTLALDQTQCGYTESKLAATEPAGMLQAGEHLLVDCKD
jgi:hypothetical protein